MGALEGDAELAQLTQLMRRLHTSYAEYVWSVGASLGPLLALSEALPSLSGGGRSSPL